MGEEANDKPFDKGTMLLILYFIERLNGVLGKTHLQKMLFLGDLLSVKKFKVPLTSIDYKRYHFGPFSAEVGEYVKELERKNLVEERQFSFISDDSKSYTRYYATTLSSARSQLLEHFGAEKALLVEEVINSYGNMSLQEVLDVVYGLEIMKGAEMDKPLDLAQKIKTDEMEPDILG